VIQDAADLFLEQSQFFKQHKSIIHFFFARKRRKEKVPKKKRR
jgi:hypothetical protein